MTNFPNQGSQTNELESLLDLIAIAEAAGVYEDEWFLNEIDKLSLRWDSYRYQKLLQKLINGRNLPSLLNQVFKTPVTEEELNLLKGDYQIGHVVNTEIQAGLIKIALSLHTLISGATGFGKTNCLNALSESIQALGDVVEWKLDPKTGMGDFRYQVKKFKNTILIPLPILKLNPFGPIKNVPRKALMERAIEVLSDSFSVYDASQGVIAEHTERLFEKIEKPCFKDLAKSVLAEKSTKFGRRQGYLDTLEVRFKNSLISLKDVFDCRDDYFDQLYDKNVIFEIGGVSDFAQKVLAPFIIMKVSLYKTYNPSSRLTHLLYFEEAQGAVFSKLLEQRARIPTVATLATQARSYGMGLVVLCQNPVTKIITEMLSNSANLICFHVGGTEVKGMMECMGLTADQAAALQHLQPGEAIFKTSFGYTEPVHVVINKIDNSPPSDAEMERLMQPKWTELLSFISPIEEQEPAELKLERTSTETKTVTAQKGLAASGKVETKSDIEQEDEMFLRDIQLRPYEFTENRYQQIRLSRNRAVKIKEKLLRLSFIEEMILKTGKRGKPPTMLMLTEKAELSLGISNDKGKGSTEHQWWQNLVLHLAKTYGLKAKMESMGADVSISNGKMDVAIEITLNDSNVQQNVIRNFQNGFAKVWIAAKDKAMMKRVQPQVATYSLKPGIINVFLLEEMAIEIKKFSTEA